MFDEKTEDLLASIVWLDNSQNPFELGILFIPSAHFATKGENLTY